MKMISGLVALIVTTFLGLTSSFAGSPVSFHFPEANTGGHKIIKVSDVESDGVSLNRVGRSLGGNMRSGPGTGFGKIRSLAEGTWVTIIANTGVRFDGYDWFEVRLDDGTRGFQWGGIMCSNGEALRGVFSICGQENAQSNYNAQSSGASAGWMAFAVGSGEVWGHGAGRTRNDAERFALNNCKGSGCRIVATTQAQCQAIAIAPGQNWIGDGGSSSQASNRAMNFCIGGGSNQCRIEYSYCQ